uniref:Phosphatidate phosphatase APP1 catalytic domain-containing protein n=1 Tax=Alexandrium monilatum TaxID=311494 RepID=A0A7S4QUA8_9DINO
MVPRRALRIVAVVLLLLSLAVPAAVYKVPWLVLSIQLVAASWLLYFCAERPVIRIVTVRARNGGKVRRRLFETLARVLLGVQSLRSSRRREQQLRSVLGTLTTCAVLFNPDVGAASVVRSSFGHPVATLVAAVVCLAITCFYHLISSCRGRGLRSPSPSDDFSSPRTSSVVQVTLRKLRSCFEANLSVWHRRSGANSVLNDLHELDDAALNELLARIPQSLLMQTLGSIEGTVALLCMDRADDLSVASKSRLLQALMRMQLTSCENAEAAVENLLLTTGGDDLSSLKCLQDGRGDIHSIRKLVFQDIMSREVQTRVLDHFLAEGMAQVAHRALLASRHFRWLMRQCRGHRCVPKSLQSLRLETGDEEDEETQSGASYDGGSFNSWLKVLFDIDDTLMCSGGQRPAGVDTRYPKHAVYPGFTTLLRELQGGSGVNQLVALSARPHMFGDIVEKGVFQRFSRLIEKHGLPTMPDLLPGALDTGIEFMISGGDDSGMRALAKKKFESFSQYLELYPEFRIVFFGDNGQGDFGVGREMHRRFPANVEQVWIHKVQRMEETPFYTKDFEGPIEFVDDYVMAAISAATRPVPLITPEGLRRVVLAAAEDFGRIDNWHGSEQREAEERRLSTSFASARQVLQGFGICEAWMEEAMQGTQEPPEEEAVGQPAEELAKQ